MSASGVLRIGENGARMFWCPGCLECHVVHVGEGPGPRWQFNGDVERPTFSPSILVTGTQRLTDDEYRRVLAGEAIEPRARVCHSYISIGFIKFLPDSTHALAGKVVKLEPVEDGRGGRR